MLDALRTRLTDGTYRVGNRLPLQRELAEHFSVSRDTVQRVLKALVSEGWIESRQGSGSRVIKTQRIQSTTARSAKSGPVPLGPMIGEAFDEPEVTLDIHTLTSQSLDTHIRVQVERIRSGEIAPQRIAVRMLLPAEELELPYPRAKDDPADARPRDRLLSIERRSTASLQDVLGNLRAENLVPDVSLEIRHAPLTPTFKLYLLNGTGALFGPYEVTERPIFLEENEEIDAIDVVEISAGLTHYVKDGNPDSPGTFFVNSMQDWFNSVWNLLAE
ncbi:winged helix-turn-helix domain-containing protein [Streptomyces flaveus]|uniref:GntR family transcriptional regulator n=1 Tax=Streptomyces flaveus TaxID=66370 RepID=A0A917QXU6_9ACTN|nr:winged helix-turn-helix domain-containing protein [Streptomyces flaveus]GGK74400.1 GntR family transcriptional regulator [Streptomyces flaveus]